MTCVICETNPRKPKSKTCYLNECMEKRTKILEEVTQEQVERAARFEVKVERLESDLEYKSKMVSDLEGINKTLREQISRTVKESGEELFKVKRRKEKFKREAFILQHVVTVETLLIVAGILGYVFMS